MQKKKKSFQLKTPIKKEHAESHYACLKILFKTIKLK